MDSFYSENELQNFGFLCIGECVKISRKASIYNAQSMKIGNNVRVDDFCILSGHIEVGNNIHIAAYTALYGGTAGIYIDDYVNLSSRIGIYAICDDFSGESMTSPVIPEQYKNVSSKPVYIGKHTIIGANSIILPGIRIAEGSAFGCFSFVNRESEEWSLNVGIPFHRIGDRKKDILILTEQYEKSRYKV